jgi:hypothetical protein
MVWIRSRNLLSLLWIRIRIHLTVLDQEDPYWKYGSGSRSMETDQNLQINLVFFRLLYLRTFFFLPNTYFKYIFHVTILLFATIKSDQDPDPDPHWFGSLDPDPH